MLITTNWSAEIFRQNNWRSADAVFEYLETLGEESFTENNLSAKDSFIASLKQLVRAIELSGDVANTSGDDDTIGAGTEDWFPTRQEFSRSGYISARKRLKKQLQLINILFEPK